MTTAINVRYSCGQPLDPAMDEFVAARAIDHIATQTGPIDLPVGPKRLFHVVHAPAANSPDWELHPAPPPPADA